ncbi:MAG: NFACT family protein [Clostridia bacterium]
MPKDIITLNALVAELNSALIGSKIEKIYQPQKEQLSFLLHNAGKKQLFFSCSSNPTIHISSVKKENPANPQTFCMVLRKYIGSGIIQNFKLLNNDRIIDVSISATNEMMDITTFHLIIEIMSRFSNIILTDETYKIKEVVKPIAFDSTTKRTLLAGFSYQYPPLTKISIFEPEKVLECLRNYSNVNSQTNNINGTSSCDKTNINSVSTCDKNNINGINSKVNVGDNDNINGTSSCDKTNINLECGGNNDDIATYILANINGFAPETLQVLLNEIGVNPKDSAFAQEFLKVLEKYINIFNSPSFAPNYARKKNGYDFFAVPYTTNCVKTSSLCEAMDYCFLNCEQKVVNNIGAKQLYNVFKAFKEKQEKKLAKFWQKINDCENAEQNKIFGDLILSNYYKIKPTDRQLITENYYDENKEIKISLDTNLTANENAQKYYKKYAKQKRTVTATMTQIAEVDNLINYLSSIEPSFELCLTPSAIKDLELELSNIGIIKLEKTKKIMQKASDFIRYKVGNFTILVGKNNIQNDLLTFKTAKNLDIWCHTKDIHGSHTIIVGEEEIPAEIIKIACEIASFYSKGRDTDKIAVDYTFKKFVKKNPNGNAGMVIYTNNKTLYVKPNKNEQYLV